MELKIKINGNYHKLLIQKFKMEHKFIYKMILFFIELFIELILLIIVKNQNRQLILLVILIMFEILIFT